MERDVLSIPHLLNLTAHVLVQEAVLLHVNLQAPPQQTQDELDSAHRDHSLSEGRYGKGDWLMQLGPYGLELNNRDHSLNMKNTHRMLVEDLTIPAGHRVHSL